MNTYIVSWSERHSVIVKAFNEIDAKDRACEGDVLLDEGGEIEPGSLEAMEIADVVE